MKSVQLLKLLLTNRELILRNNGHAAETLLELNEDCKDITNEEIILNLEFNNSLAELFFHSRYDNAIANSLKSIGKFKHSLHHHVLAEHYWLVGHCYAHKGDYESSKENLLIALNITEQINPVPIKLKSDILLSLAMNEELHEKGPEKSIQYLEEAINLMDDEANSVRKANCLMGLGNVYVNIDRDEEALQHYLLAALTFEHHLDLQNMASAYSKIGTAYIKLKNYEKAEDFLEKSLELRIKAGSPDDLSISYYNLAIVYRDTKKFDRAEELLHKSREILTRTGSKPFFMQTEEMLKEVALERGELGSN